MEHWNGLPTSTKVEELVGTDENSSDAKIDLPNSYTSVIGMMLYLTSNTIPYIYFTVNKYDQLIHITKALHETSTNRICQYLQGSKDRGLVFNPSNKMVVNCYADADFAGLWLHENPQDPI